jgi:hypothetical protein
MKVLLLIPDGVGIRNFLCTRFIDLLLKSGEVVIWHALPETHLATHQQRLSRKVKWRRLPDYREGFIRRLLRQSKIYAQLYWRRESGSDVLLKLMRPSGRRLNRLLGHLARSLGRACAGPRRVAWLDSLHARSIQSAGSLREFESLLAEERPDVLFCTHQRASLAGPAMCAARGMSIPTATFIYSWDNLPKGRMAVHADHYFVWSDFMKDELMTYYPEVSTERIHVVGTPQFEHYFNPSLVQSRAAFLRGLGLEPSRPVVCFSGDDVTTSPYDQEYLADLAEALRRIPLARRPQILFRRCPVDTSARYDWVLKKYTEIAVSSPLWETSGGRDWTQVVPTVEDVALLVNVVRHCELVVNVASTMSMDFAILNKPGIYLAYDSTQAMKSGKWSVHDVYRLPHFRLVHEVQPVYWANSAATLETLVCQALTHREEKAEARRVWLRKQVKGPLDEASARCVDALRLIAPAQESDAPALSEHPAYSLV